MIKSGYSFLKKISWGTFWAIFSQTHLVTLVLSHLNISEFFFTHRLSVLAVWG
jgi:hypothetical protein